MTPDILNLAILSIVIVTVVGGLISWIILAPKIQIPNYGKRRILCIGDSITFGSGVLRTRWKDTYPAILENKLGEEFQVLNYGIPGATLVADGDKPYSQAFLKAARKTNPEIILLMLGTNDSKSQNWDAEKYEAALQHWASELNSYSSKPQVFVMAPPAAFRVDHNPVVYGIQDIVIRDEIFPAVKRQAALHATGFIDLYTPTQGRPELFTDGVHPNAHGNRILAQHIFDVLIKIIE